MGRFVRGSVVVVNYFFTDLSGSKRRPAVVVADLEGDDLIICPIVSSRSDRYSVRVTSQDISGGQLRKDSFIRPNIVNTVDSSRILYGMGELSLEKMAELSDKLKNILGI
ncbi:MAG: type II toxin-antitoxin system PemK/MazF family toxin [Desulfomonilaceae bacterium]